MSPENITTGYFPRETSPLSLRALIIFSATLVLVPLELLYYVFEVEPFQAGFIRSDFFDLIIIFPSITAAIGGLLLSLLPIKFSKKLYILIGSVTLNAYLGYLLVPYYREIFPHNLNEVSAYFGVLIIPAFYFIGLGVGQGLYVIINRVASRLYVSLFSKILLRKAVFVTSLVVSLTALFFLAQLVKEQANIYSSIDNRVIRCGQRETVFLYPNICFEKVLDDYGDKFKIDSCRKLSELNGGRYSTCFYILAVARKDPSLCWDAQYPKSLVGGSCYGEIYELSGKDPGVCENLIETSEKDSCFKEAALSANIKDVDPKKDAEKKLALCNFISNTARRWSCYSEVAIFALRHVSKDFGLQICERISDKSQLDACSVKINELK